MQEEVKDAQRPNEAPERQAAAGPAAGAGGVTAGGEGGGEPQGLQEAAEASGPGDAEAATAPAAEPAAEPAPEERIRALEEALAAAQAEKETYLDDLRRLQAEFDNYRKRMLREQTARIATATGELVERLLPVLDAFELAISAAEQSRDFDKMLKGVEMVYGELRDVLRAEGLRPIEAQGKEFDPERHEAIVAVEQEGVEPNTVVEVVRTGYELNGKVLRPAMVKVTK